MKVTSPTYLLDNIYTYHSNSEGIQTIHHFDLYRLPTGCNLDMLGIPKIYNESICLIEWPQRLNINNQPKEYLNVMITITNDNETAAMKENNSNTRCVTLIPYGDKWNKKILLLTQSLFENEHDDEEENP